MNAEEKRRRKETCRFAGGAARLGKLAYARQLYGNREARQAMLQEETMTTAIQGTHVHLEKLESEAVFL